MDTNDNPRPTTSFTLSSLLGNGIQLIIPDMQRDYCWGTASEGSAKAPIFVSGLVQLFKNGRTTPLGLLYGYEAPARSGRIHIIDGQQRLTTLYLLIGLLYRRTPTYTLRRMLITNSEMLDDYEPCLIYQSRNEAMYFLTDLLVNFFLNRDGRLSQIEKSAWYYSVYDSDQTIQSFINALREIDKVLEQAAASDDWDFAEFADFVCSNLSFVYHDLGDRTAAEDMFLTINTTGQPLTLPQILKSTIAHLHTGDYDIMAKWEEMEKWAWLHRDHKEGLTTSDGMMQKILDLWSISARMDFSKAFDQAKFKELYITFGCYRTLIDCVPEAIACSAKKSEDLFLLVPSIAFIRKWKFDLKATPFQQTLIKRFWDFLYNITRYQKVTASGSDMLAALSIAAKMPAPEITSLANVSALPERLVNSEERAKIALLTATNDPHRAYTLIQYAQSHPLLNGRVEKLISWSKRPGEHIDLNKMQHYIDYIYEIWGDDINRNPKLDLVRAALLSLRHKGYPIVRRGDTCLSLCWQDYDWQRLMTSSPGLIRLLIDRLSAYGIPAKDGMRKMVEKMNDRSYPYLFLMRDDKSLASCRNRMLLRPSEPFLGYYVQDDIDGHRATIKWHVEQIPLPSDSQRWSTFRSYGAKCLYTDHRFLNLSIDLYHTPGQRDKYRIEIFCRSNTESTRKKPGDIAGWVRSIGYPVRFDPKRKRHCTYLSDARKAVEMIRALIASDLLDSLF